MEINQQIIRVRHVSGACKSYRNCDKRCQEHFSLLIKTLLSLGYNMSNSETTGSWGCWESESSICESCEVVDEISDVKLSKYLSSFNQKKGMKFKRFNLEFFGLCQKCK